MFIACFAAKGIWVLHSKGCVFTFTHKEGLVRCWPTWRNTHDSIHSQADDLLPIRPKWSSLVLPVWLTALSHDLDTFPPLLLAQQRTFWTNCKFWKVLTNSITVELRSRSALNFWSPSHKLLLGAAQTVMVEVNRGHWVQRNIRQSQIQSFLT